MAWRRRFGSKYGAIPVVVNGIRFASKAEGKRYWDLLLRQKAGEISDLELQPTFKFPCGTNYRADFRYTEKGKVVVEDVKGFQTPVFRLKLKMLKAHYPEVDLKII
jgi:hypothetical protein